MGNRPNAIERAFMKRALRMGVTLLVIAVLVAAAGLLVVRKKAALATAPRYGLGPTPVRVGVAREGTLEISRDYLAVVEPIRTAALAARLTARVESVEVDEGSIVRSGDPLVRLDGQEIRDAIDTTKAQIDQVEAERAGNDATVVALEKSVTYWTSEAKRLNRLREEDLAAPTETGAATDKVDVLTGQLQAARRKSEALRHQAEALRHTLSEHETRLGYCTIASPYDGVVTYRHVDPGDLATPDKALLVVEDRQQLKLGFAIPQQDVALVKPGMAVRFRVAREERTAPLSHLYPALDDARMLRAEVWLSGSLRAGLDSGAYLPVTIILARLEGVTLIPASSVVESPDRRPHVFMVAGDELQPVAVTILGERGDEVAVGGLQPGGEVVLSTFLGWAQLSSGQKVKAMR